MYKKHMTRELFIAIAGIVITAVSYNSAASSPGGGTYLICWGAIIVGLIDFFVGFVAWQKYQ